MTEKNIIRTMQTDADAKGLTPREYYLKDQRIRVPLKREITPADIGDAVVFFVSERSKCITAQSLNVDAGYRPR